MDGWKDSKKGTSVDDVRSGRQSEVDEHIGQRSRDNRRISTDESALEMSVMK